jgi:hypothetical protein
MGFKRVLIADGNYAGKGGASLMATVYQQTEKKSLPEMEGPAVIAAV